MTHETIEPHGGTLIDLLAPQAESERLVEAAAALPTVLVNHRELADLEMLANGALSPLTGFQGERDYHSILETMHLTNGLAWTIPVTLSVSDDELQMVQQADRLALLSHHGGDPLAILEVSEVFARDRAKEAKSVFGTEDLEHPGVRALHEAGDHCVAGELRVIRLPQHHDFVMQLLKIAAQALGKAFQFLEVPLFLAAQPAVDPKHMVKGSH